MHFAALINWALILKEAPKIVDSARRMYEALSKRKGARRTPQSSDDSDSGPAMAAAIAESQSRIDDLEADNARQAELISQMATQEEAMTHAIQTVATRVTLLTWLAAGALLLAAASLVVSLIS